MTMSCGLPVCLSGIQVSSQVLSVKQPDCSCYVQCSDVKRTSEINLRRDCSAVHLAACCLVSSPSISTLPYSDGTASRVELPVTSAEVQFVKRRPICTLSKRRKFLVKQMMELDLRRKALKQQQHRAQQVHRAPLLIQALLQRPEFLSEDGFQSTAANAA